MISAFSASRLPYCGNPPMRLSALFARDPAGGVPALFEGRRVHWSLNTRVAIRAACDVLGLVPGDEVLAPAYCCGSELDPLIHAGLKVTLYPVARTTDIDPAAVAARITPRTRAVYVTHYFGRLQPELAALRALCDARGLRLIEDCALSLLSGARPAEGTSGDVAVFCLYKFFPVLAGGALVVNATDLDRTNPFRRAPSRPFVAKHLVRSALTATLGAERAQAAAKVLRRRSRRGGAAGAEVRSPAGLPDMPAHYYFDPAMRNARISTFAARPIRAFDVSAAIAARRANWRVWQMHMADMAGVTPLWETLAHETCPLSMPVLVDGRDAVAAGMQAHGIAATPWWSGFSRNLDWTDQRGAADLKNRVLSLPLHQGLGKTHIERMAAVLRDLTGSAAATSDGAPSGPERLPAL